MANTNHSYEQSHDELESPGFAGSVARAFIHSPLSPLLLIACLFLGLGGLYFTPRQEDPQISVPMVDIFFQFPGAEATQVASLASDPLERLMGEIPGVKHVYSASQRGQGMVTVQFEVGEEMGPSLVKLHDKLSSNMDKIPPGVGQPLIKPKGVDDVPVVTLTLWSSELNDAGLRLVALEMQQRISEVKNTSQSFVIGGRSEEMRIEVLPERLKGFGISVAQIARTVKAANMKRAVGNTEAGGLSSKVYTGNFLRHARDVESLIVGVRNASPVYLRDVAKVIEGPGEAKNLVQYFTGPAADKNAPHTKGASAVTIAIAKKQGSNGVSVANAILAKVEVLKQKIVPGNVQVAVTRNYGQTANNKVNELLLKLTDATVAVAFLIFLFLGFRPMIVVGIIIPIVVLMTIFSALLIEYTIDRVSLFALIFSIGILVDDATVVVENIYRRWLMKGSVDTATTIDAVREVGNPTILATFTIIAALLPMGFVSGMMGPYMRPIPVLGSVAMMFSLIAAFVFTPWLAMRVRPSLTKLRQMEKSEHKLAERLDGFYRRFLGPLLDSPSKARIFRLTIWGLFMLSCALFYTQHVAVKMLPLDNKPEFNIVINMPDGTALPETANVIQQMTEKVLKIAEVTAVQTYTGTASPFNFNGLVRHYYLRQNPWQGDIQVQLLDKDDRDRSSHEVAVEARALLTPLAKKLGAKIAVVEMPPGPPVLQTMVAEIYGPDAKTRRQVARDMTKIFEKAETIVDVDNYMQDDHDNWVFEVNQRKAEHRNITVQDITSQLSMIMGGYRLGDVKVGRELEPRRIVLQAPLAVRSQISRLGEVPITTRDKKLVPLSELGSFVRQAQDPLIFHKDLRPLEYVTGEVAGRLAAPVYGMVEVSRLLANYKTPDGVELSGTYFAPPEDGFKSGFEWTGEWTVTFETFRDMGLAFMAAMVLIYMLIVMEFGNFRLPGIIMAPIPLTLIGIIPGHWLLGAEFTATSMIGWIALAGIIVRNSILLVDFSKNAILSGVDKREAVIMAVKTRTRPILITQLTLIAGSAGIITDPIFQGMAISLLFGAVVATCLTLFVIPLACVRAKDAYKTSADGAEMAAACAVPTAEQRVEAAVANEQAGMDEGVSIWSRITGALTMGYYILRAPLILIGASLKSLFGDKGMMVFYVLRAIPLMLWYFVRDSINALFSSSKDHGSASKSTSSPMAAPVGAATARAEKSGLSSATTTSKPGKSKSGKSAKAPASGGTAKSGSKTRGETKKTPTKSRVKKTATKPVRASAKSGKKPAASKSKPTESKASMNKTSKTAAKSGSKRKSVARKTTTKPAATKKAAPARKAATSVRAKTSAIKKKTPVKAKAVKSGSRSRTIAARRDDLKSISGIGPAIEKKLNTLGIARFDQIATMKKGDMIRIDDKLGFTGRIAREKWVSQAKKLARKSNGATPPAKQATTRRTATKTVKASVTKKVIARKPAVSKASAKTKAKATARAKARLIPAKKVAIIIPDTPDNLQMIKGVGPGLEKKLNGMGITNYVQIASWKMGDVMRFDTRLNFKGRIDRDDWVGQAKNLAKAGNPARSSATKGRATTGKRKG